MNHTYRDIPRVTYIINSYKRWLYKVMIFFWKFIFLHTKILFLFFSLFSLKPVSNYKCLHPQKHVVLVDTRPTDISWCTVAWWMTLLPHSREVSGCNPGRKLSVWSFYVLLVPAWVFSGYFGFLSQTKSTHVRLTCGRSGRESANPALIRRCRAQTRSCVRREMGQFGGFTV